jgi:hypothetical protein
MSEKKDPEQDPIGFVKQYLNDSGFEVGPATYYPDNKAYYLVWPSPQEKKDQADFIRSMKHIPIQHGAMLPGFPEANIVTFNTKESNSAVFVFKEDAPHE